MLKSITKNRVLLYKPGRYVSGTAAVNAKVNPKHNKSKQEDSDPVSDALKKTKEKIYEATDKIAGPIEDELETAKYHFKGTAQELKKTFEPNMKSKGKTGKKNQVEKEEEKVLQEEDNVHRL